MSNKRYDDCRNLVEAFENGNTEDMEAVANLPNVDESEETEKSYIDVPSTDNCGSGYIFDPDDGSCVPLCESGRCFEILKKYKNDKQLYKRLSKTEQDKIKTLITVMNDKDKPKTVQKRSSNKQLKIGDKYSSSSSSVQSNPSRQSHISFHEDSPDIITFEEPGITFEDEGEGIQYTGSKIEEEEEEPYGSNLFDTTSVNSKTSDISGIFKKASQGSRTSIHSQKIPSFQLHDTTPQSTRLSVHSILDENPSHHSFKSHVSSGRRSSDRQSIFNMFDDSEPNLPSRHSSRTSNNIRTCLFLLKEENERRKRTGEPLLTISDSGSSPTSKNIDKLLQHSKKILQQTIKTGEKIKKKCKPNEINDPERDIGHCISTGPKGKYFKEVVKKLKRDENYLDNFHTDEDRIKTCKRLNSDKTLYNNIAKNKCRQYIGRSSQSSGTGLIPEDVLSITSKLQSLSDKIQSSRHSSQHGSQHSRRSSQHSRRRSQHSLHDDASDSYSLFLTVNGKPHNKVQENIQNGNKCTGNKIKNPLSGRCIEIDKQTFNNNIKDYLLNEDCAMYKNAFSREDQAKLQRKFKQLKNCH